MTIGIKNMLPEGIIHPFKVDMGRIVPDVPGIGIVIFDAVAAGTEKIVAGIKQYLPVKDTQETDAQGKECKK